MVQAKTNSYLNIPVYRLISWSNIKYEKKIIITARCILTQAVEKDDEQHFN